MWGVALKDPSVLADMAAESGAGESRVRWVGKSPYLTLMRYQATAIWVLHADMTILI